MIARFHNAFKGVTITETFNPFSFRHSSPPPTASNPLTKFSFLPPAGIMSEVYEKQRLRGIPLYTPVTEDDLNEVCREMKKEEQAFTNDCVALIGDVENGRIGSTLSEGVRRFEEESIPQGELIFPDEVSGHSSSSSRSPSPHRNQSRSYSRSRSRSHSRRHTDRGGY